MKHKLNYALLCALSLSALTVSAADSGNSDPLQLNAGTSIDTLRCVNTMSSWNSVNNPPLNPIGLSGGL
jgi:hypothetical protein